MEEQIKTELVDFIVANYLFGDAGRAPADGDSFVETGIVDSTGILELIVFLEDRYGITISDTETVPENLDSIANLTRFVLAKQAAAEPTR